MWNSKSVGNFGEIKTISKFIELGIPVYVAFGDNERCDLIAEFNGKLNKIQCKTSKKTDDIGTFIEFSCRSSHRVNGKCVNEKYTSEDVDFFATTYRDKCYLIP